ncbi:GGDEF domain-containing protein [Pseudoalteromonas sp.]|uniref:GGDEF domain-containing protein n=1 Tax=Pseudoalteromonas sp. TaxID=53249 RepID=UPI003566A1F5
MKTLLHILDSRTPERIWMISVVLVLLLSGIYLLIGEVVEIEPIFVIPVIVTSWYGSSRSGVLLGFLTVAILISEKYFVFGMALNIDLLVYYAVPYIVAYSAVAIIITNFRNVHRVESVAADTDYLTGLSNSRRFYIELASELVRANRYKHTFSLAYIDVDGFKEINDTLGHDVGDKLLIGVAQCLSSNLREVDTVARLGGDEFSCLLPETKSSDAKHAFLNVIRALKRQMNANNWPVTFSIGLVTFEEIPDNVKEVVKVADELMYSVKNKEKNDIAYQIWHGKA